MTLIQLGIGITNDVLDAPADAGHKPGKPIPAGLVAARTADLASRLAFGAGVGLATIVSGRLGVLAVGVVVIGLAYDVRLKGTAWSWLPFAIGIPILPVFGWLASGRSFPPLFGVLVPAAVLAGAALAIGNSLVDVERDRAAGRTSVAAALGQARASLATAGLFGLVMLLAAATTPAGSLALPAVVILGLVPIAAAAAARRTDPGRREMAWRLEAVATAVLAITWFVGQVAALPD